jgi:hypothetical protein
VPQRAYRNDVDHSSRVTACTRSWPLRVEREVDTIEREVDTIEREVDTIKRVS